MPAWAGAVNSAKVAQAIENEGFALTACMGNAMIRIIKTGKTRNDGG
ncbi:hypothetical protein [uncultured Pelagimonas sp.]|nr:hypothetical protein [uncultured Pelagimonas sp.]